MAAQICAERRFIIFGKMDNDRRRSNYLHPSSILTSNVIRLGYDGQSIRQIPASSFNLGLERNNLLKKDICVLNKGVRSSEYYRRSVSTRILKTALRMFGLSPTSGACASLGKKRANSPGWSVSQVSGSQSKNSMSRFSS